MVAEVEAVLELRTGTAGQAPPGSTFRHKLERVPTIGDVCMIRQRQTDAEACAFQLIQSLLL